MIVYNAVFKKSDGTERNMNFVKLVDLPHEFLSTKVKGGDTTSRQSSLAEGQELVWDVGVSGFRIFNWNTVVGTITENQATITMEGENFIFEFTNDINGVNV